jgi:hypothetical protein
LRRQRAIDHEFGDHRIERNPQRALAAYGARNRQEIERLGHATSV